MPSRVVIITGMHRSGTSLFANLIRNAGVNLGDRLLDPGEDNPHGYFEDVDFVELHRGMLLNRGYTLIVDRNFEFIPTQEERLAAHNLMSRRSHLSLWGWKDPRTSLFLDFWAEVIPDARFIFLFRHPFDVLVSLMNRGEIHSTGLLEGLEAWYAYNLRIIDFYRRNCESSVLLDIYSVIDKIEKVNELLNYRLDLGINLDRSLLESLYRPAELSRYILGEDSRRILEFVHPDSLELFADLQKEADIAGIYSKQDSENDLISSLLALVEYLPRPPLTAQRRAVLMMFLAFFDHEIVERMAVKVRRSISELERSHQWHQSQHANWKSESNKLQTLLDDQQSWIRQLEEARDYHAQQAENWKRLAEERAAWIAQLEEARDYPAQQAENWRRLAEERATWIGQLEEARDYHKRLAEERAAWIEQIRRLPWYRIMASLGIAPR
ncbi:MAG: sulfotransferase [Roseiflexus sp.]|uniref:sulfotransferase n=1 Tax=Roseiflexus sp. TaxID=2562120 RepID=UPI0025D5BB79|nr:sulfotransferase [Roseiflexus sp.]MCL6540386.1 sulfotransferase [Roseiflexus sp.]